VLHLQQQALLPLYLNSLGIYKIILARNSASIIYIHPSSKM